VRFLPRIKIGGSEGYYGTFSEGEGIYEGFLLFKNQLIILQLLCHYIKNLNKNL